MKWYDFIYFPWTVNKWLWEQLHKKKPSQESGRPPQMSCYGTALPLVYGRTRLTGNIIYFDDGAGWVDPSTMTKVMLAICEGEITGVLRSWRDKEWWWTLAENNMACLTGTRPTQTAWAELPAGKDLGYPGVACVVSASTPWILDSIGQWSFEIQGLLDATGDATNGDANPADILSGTSSMLTNTAFGAGFPYSVVVATGRDGTAASSARRYVEQEQLWISPAFTEQRPAKSHLQDVLDAINCTALWTGRSGSAALEIVPLGDQVVGTYTPYNLAQYALGPGDFLPLDDGDRIRISWPTETDVCNITPIEFLERSPIAAATDPGNAYNVSIVDDPDPVDVALRGERRASVQPMHAICLRDVALKISRIHAQRAVNARAQYEFRLPWKFGRLEPLDFLIVTDPLLGLSSEPVRITRIREKGAEDGWALDVEAIEWPEGVGGVVAHNTGSGEGVIAFGWKAEGGTTLRAILDKTSVSGTVTDTTVPASSLSATTDAVTASLKLATTPPYTYLWSWVSGTTATINSSTAATTTFTRAGACTLAGNVLTGTYRCRITDSVGRFDDSAPVTVTTTHLYDPP